jgi:D-lactate dehydrogenase
LYNKKIGPDPASINACMIGGIIANNSSGMCCGVTQNSYNTLVDMKLILADGTLLDTAVGSESRLRFEKTHAYLIRHASTT